MSSPALQIIACLGLLFSWPISGPGQQPIQIKFKTMHQMILVPVTINGAGPFNFLVDTGSSHTIIDAKLAEKLHLRVVGRMEIRTAQPNTTGLLVAAPSLSMAGAIAYDLNLVVVKRYADFFPGISGSIGEDFLQNFDLLIDNRHHFLHLDRVGGTLTNIFAGEHLSLSLQGVYEQTPTPNRLVVIGTFLEHRDLRLQLDSGTETTVVFSRLAPQATPLNPSTVSFLGGIFGSSFEANTQTFELQLGRKTYRNVAVLIPSSVTPPMDVDGYLPTSLFDSILISHSGKYVILNPASIRPVIVAQTENRSQNMRSLTESVRGEPSTLK